MVDITGLLNSSGIHPEKAAADLLGAQIDLHNSYGLGGIAASAISQNFQVGNTVNEGSIDPGGEIFGGRFESTRYASDLIQYAPKHRFLFKVFFRFETPYITSGGGNIQDQHVFSYMVKLIDKPKVTFEYEPVNYYNYKTQILKAVRYDPLNITFYDDNQNKVLDFFVKYQQAHNPISRFKPTETNNEYRDGGMGFTMPGNDSDRYSGNRGVLREDKPRMLTHLILRQYFGNGYHSNAFYFVNPRIESFDFDNVDHEEGGSGNSMVASFNYDSLYVESFDTAPATPISNQDGDNQLWGTRDILGYGLPGSAPTWQQMGTQNRMARNMSNIGGSVLGQIAGTKVASVLRNSGFERAFPTFSGDIIGSAATISGNASKSALYQASQNVNQSSAGTNNDFGANVTVISDPAVSNAASNTHYIPPVDPYAATSTRASRLEPMDFNASKPDLTAF